MGWQDAPVEFARGSALNKENFFANLELEDSKFRALNFAKVLTIDVADFLKILQQFPEDRETYFFIRDQVLYSSKHLRLNRYCIACGSIFHNFWKCPGVTYQSNRLLVSYSDSMKKNVQPRDPVFKRHRKKQKDKKNYITNVQRAIDYFQLNKGYIHS